MNVHFSELLGLSKERGATQINRWCQEKYYGTSTMDAREKLIKMVLIELIKKGIDANMIYENNLMPGYSLRTIKQKVRDYWGSYEDALKLFRTSILGHLLRKDASKEVIAEILMIPVEEVDQVIRHVFGKSRENLKNFFTSSYLGLVVF